MWLLSSSARPADANNEKVVAMLLGKDIKPLAQTLIEHGADKVMVVDHDLLKDYMTEPYTEAITAIIESEKPSIMLIGATTIGRDLGPATAPALPPTPPSSKSPMTRPTSSA